MPRRAKGLNAAGLEHLPPGKHADGGGLYLLVRANGARLWTCRYMLAGRAREMGLGAFSNPKPKEGEKRTGRSAPSVSLAEARKKAGDAARMVAAGYDPLDHRRAEREAAAERAALKAEEVLTFRAVAERLIAAQAPGWTSAKTLASWRLTMDKHAFPVIGNRPIIEVNREDVVRALSGIWVTQPATARKLQRRISAVLDFAPAHGWRAADNPATGRVLRLTRALPAVRVRNRKQASLPWSKVPALLRAVSLQAGVAPLALRFLALTALRSNEVRQLQWSDVRFEDAIVVIPAERMKGGKLEDREPHRLPLTPAMLAVLADALAWRTGSQPDEDTLSAQAALLRDALVFPNSQGKALSAAALEAVIARAGGKRPEGQPSPWCDVDGREATPHGMRRAFRTWVGNTRAADGEAAEAQLGHRDESETRGAYKDDLLHARVELMRAWNLHCCLPPSAAKMVRKLRAASR